MQQNFEYEQRAHLDRWNHAHENGVCLALSAWWIIKKSAGEDFKSWLESDRAVRDSKEIYDVESRMKREADERDAVIRGDDSPDPRGRGPRRLGLRAGAQRAHDGQRYTTHMLRALESCITLKGRNLTAGWRGTHEGISLTAMNALILLGTGYKLINWRARKLAAAGHSDAAHAVAVEVRPDCVLLFEPNSGEWETTRGQSEFPSFFTFLCKSYGLDHIDQVSVIGFEAAPSPSLAGAAAASTAPRYAASRGV